eukprot:5288262-Prymnesium_polylepis.1
MVAPCMTTSPNSQLEPLTCQNQHHLRPQPPNRLPRAARTMQRWPGAVASRAPRPSRRALPSTTEETPGRAVAVRSRGETGSHR